MASRCGAGRTRVASRASASSGDLLAVVGVEAVQEVAAFLVGELLQIGLPGRIVGVGQQGAAGILGAFRHIILRDVAHHADEGQVDRAAQRLGHGRDRAVVLVVEIDEGVDAAAGEEAFARIGGIAALHGGVQQGGQAAVRRVRQVCGNPARQVVGRVRRHRAKLRARQVGVAAVQFGDDFQIGDQGAQLGGRAEVQLGALVDVQRPVQVVGLDADIVRVHPALVQHDAVDHPVQVVLAGVEQAEARHAKALDEARLVQLGQHFDHVRLGRAVQAGFRRQVIAVELVEAGHVQHAEQPGADRVGGLLFHERNGRRQRGIVPETQLDAQGRRPAARA